MKFLAVQTCAYSPILWLFVVGSPVVFALVSVCEGLAVLVDHERAVRYYRFLLLGVLPSALVSVCEGLPVLAESLVWLPLPEPLP